MSDILHDGDFENAQEIGDEVVSTLKLQNGYKGFAEAFPTEAPCWGAYELGRMATDKGFGPMLSDIVLSDVKIMTPDRLMVRPAAANLFKYYRDRRTDIDKKPFDDVHNPKTPPKEDDCRINDDGDELNYAYSMKGSVDSSGLKKNHVNFVMRIRKLVTKFGGKIVKDQIESAISEAGDEFFTQRYAATSPFR